MKSVEGTCRDCGMPFYGRDAYIVRPTVWKAAGLNGWRSGLLHLKCLEKRLGRRVNKREFLIRKESGVHRVRLSDADETADLFAKGGDVDTANALMIQKRNALIRANGAKKTANKERQGRMMTPTKTFAEMTPEERQKLVDDICRAFEALKQAGRGAARAIAVRDAVRAIVAAFNSFPPEVRAALLCPAASAPDEQPELPEPDQIIHRDGNTQGSAAP
jgi:hypothetical protein